MSTIIDHINTVELNEAKKRKPFIGTADGFSWAINLKGVQPANDFPKTRGFGGLVDNRKLIGEFEKSAKKGYVGAKGKDTLKAVKSWIKMNKPSEFYAKWKTDSAMYKDDSVEIFYKD